MVLVGGGGQWIKWGKTTRDVLERAHLSLGGVSGFCADMYIKDGLHLSGKGAAVFADGLAAAVDSGMGSITNIFGSQHYLNKKCRGVT